MAAPKLTPVLPLDGAAHVLAGSLLLMMRAPPTCLSWLQLTVWCAPRLDTQSTSRVRALLYE